MASEVEAVLWDRALSLRGLCQAVGVKIELNYRTPSRCWRIGELIGVRKHASLTHSRTQ